MISGDRSALLAESAVLKRLKSLAEHCALLTVMICYRGPSCVQSYGSVQVIGVDMSNPITGFFRALRIGKNHREPHVVATQDPFFFGIIGLFLAWHYGVPLQIQIHTDVFSKEYRTFSFSNRFRAFLARVTIPQAAGVRVVSERIARSLEKRRLIPKDRVTILPLPVLRMVQGEREHPVFRGLAERWSPTILMVTRLAPEKNVPLAFSLFLAEHPHAGLLIVGEGPLQSTLRALTERLGIADHVIYAGQERDVAPYYAGADIFLSTSQYEGYGLALVEAAFAGLPIVSTDAGVARELGARIVNLNARSVAEALSEPTPPASVPPGLTVCAEDYAEHIAKQWEELSQRGYTSQRAVTFGLVAKYIISGGSATAANLALLFVFTDFLRIWYVLSAALAYAGAFVVSFTLQKFWTFQNGALEKIHSQFAVYVGLGTFNMVLNAGLIYLIVESTGIHYLIAQIGIGILIACWSFLFYRVLFANT